MDQGNRGYIVEVREVLWSNFMCGLSIDQYLKEIIHWIMIVHIEDYIQAVQRIWKNQFHCGMKVKEGMSVTGKHYYCEENA